MPSGPGVVSSPRADLVRHGRDLLPWTAPTAPTAADAPRRPLRAELRDAADHLSQLQRTLSDAADHTETLPPRQSLAALEGGRALQIITSAGKPRRAHVSTDHPALEPGDIAITLTPALTARLVESGGDTGTADAIVRVVTREEAPDPKVILLEVERMLHRWPMSSRGPLSPRRALAGVFVPVPAGTGQRDVLAIAAELRHLATVLADIAEQHSPVADT